MKIFRYLLPAAVVLCAASAPASAFPVQNTTAVDSSKIDVQHRMDRRGPPPHVHRKGPPPRYVPGRRYNSAPPGWRRYGARPGDWRRRGCVMAGPIWFCP